MAAPNPVRIIPATSGNLRAGGEYVIRDEFTTDRAAGAVHNTAAEPGPGTRTVVDTESKITIAGGALTFAGGRASPAYGNPQFALSGFVSVAGRVSIVRLTPSQTDRVCLFLLSSDLIGTITASTPYAIFTSAAQLKVHTGISEQVVVTYSTGAHALAIVTRSTGCYYFVKIGAAAWYLVYVRHVSCVSTLYPAIQNYNATFTADYLRVPLARWLPTPLVSHGFGSTFGTSDGLGHAEGVAGGIGAGGSGVTFSNAGNTWSVSGGKAINTPTLGATEFVTNGNMELDSDWSSLGSPTTSERSNTRAYDGTYSWHGKANGAYGGFSQVKTGVTIGQWFKFSAYVWVVSGTIQFKENAGTGPGVSGNVISSTGSWINSTFTTRNTSANVSPAFLGATAGAEFYIDSAAIRALSLTELLSLSNLACYDVLAGSSIVVRYEIQAGLALNWDSPTSPANGVIVYLCSGKIWVDKCVAGAWSNVSSTAYTYSAGARLVVAKNGTEYRTYYNNVLIKADTIADAGILSNTYHGLFSTDASNTLDDLAIYATGTSNEYAALDAF